MSKAIKRLHAYGMGGTFDQPGYEYDPVNDTFKDVATGKVFSKEYVAPNSGSSTIKLEDNKQVSITANGEVEITPTAGKDGMKKVTANVTVPMPVLEANKATTIDVSQYTEPVEITPTSGKDAMEKNTITLTNIPVAGGTMPGTWYRAYMNGYAFIKQIGSAETTYNYVDNINAWTNQPLTDAGTYDILVYMNSAMIYKLNNDSDTGTFESIKDQLVLFKDVPLVKEDDGCGDYIFKSYTDNELDGNSNPTVMIRPDGNGKVSVPGTMSEGDYGIAFELTV